MKSYIPANCLSNCFVQMLSLVRYRTGDKQKHFIDAVLGNSSHVEAGSWSILNNVHVHTLAMEFEEDDDFEEFWQHAAFISPAAYALKYRYDIESASPLSFLHVEPFHRLVSLRLMIVSSNFLTLLLSLEALKVSVWNASGIDFAKNK